MISLGQRAAILRLYKAGRSAGEIARQLAVARNTVVRYIRIGEKLTFPRCSSRKQRRPTSSKPPRPCLGKPKTVEVYRCEACAAAGCNPYTTVSPCVACAARRASS